MSLYLKYRPQTFQSMVGQKHIVSTLENAIKHDSLTHAYLFSGPRGTGKTSLARIVAKSLNCLNLQDEKEPCDHCENCEAILNGRLVDLIEIDAASNRGIDEIRDLKEKIQFTPTHGKCKVYIIDEVHMLTKEAFNALLKTLEEPPEHAFFILATTESHKIPETIISRCQQFNFKRISQEDIVERLKEIAETENVQAEPDALELMGKVSGGGLRDAIGLFEQMTIDGAIIYQEVVSSLGITGHMLIDSFFKEILDKNASKAIELIAQVNSQGLNLTQFCGEWIAYLREQMLLGVNEGKPVPELVKMIEIFSEAKTQINSSLIPQLPLEIAVYKSCDFKNEKAKPVEEQAVEETSEKEESDSAETTSEPETAAEAEPVSDGATLSLDAIKEKWQRIVDQIETPFIRMSFVDGEPVRFESGELTMMFRSSTLMEKVQNPSNQGEILKSFDAVLGIKPSLKLEVKKISLGPVVKKEEETEEPSVAEMAKEVFGA